MNRVAAQAVVLLVLCSFSGAALAGSAPEGTSPETSITDAKLLLLEQTFSGKLSVWPQDHGGCTAVGTVSCPSVSVSGNLANTDCHLNDNSYADTYHFAGTAGQQVTIDLTAAAFDTFVLLRSPSGAMAAFDDDSGPGLNSHLVFTLNATGTWAVVANSAFANLFGTYNLTMTCSGANPSCVETSTALCLNNNRFRVEATFQTGSGQTGTANVVKLTSETGYLWFFNSTNVEAVVKVLDSCSFNSRFWVFAGGLTDVRVNFTITDTRSGTVKTYVNPLGTAFAPIQDTSAFATCP